MRCLFLFGVIALCCAIKTETSVGSNKHHVHSVQKHHDAEEDQPITPNPACCHRFKITGLENTLQTIRMGIYSSLPEPVAGKTGFKHEGKEEFLFFFNQDRWLIGPTIGKDDTGLFALRPNFCVSPTEGLKAAVKWFDGTTFKDGEIVVTCVAEASASKPSASEGPKMTFAEFAKAVDLDQNGDVSPSELAKALEITEAEASSILKTPGLDQDGDGKISALELANWIDKEKVGHLTIASLAKALVPIKEAFEKAKHFFAKHAKQGQDSPADEIAFSALVRYLDADASGGISADELAKGMGVTEAIAKKVISKLDKDSDGSLSANELKAALQPNAQGNVGAVTIAGKLFEDNDVPKAVKWIQSIKAKQSPKFESIKLSDMLKYLDVNKDNQLAADELAKGFNIPKARAEEIVQQLDRDADKSISSEEFSMAMEPNPTTGLVTSEKIASRIFGDKDTTRSDEWIKLVKAAIGFSGQTKQPISDKDPRATTTMLVSEILKRLDPKNTGNITPEQFASGLKIGLTAANRVVAALDQNSDNVVSVTELKDALDRNADGKASMGTVAIKLFEGNLPQALKWAGIDSKVPRPSDSEQSVTIDELIRYLDIDGDGKISTPEFVSRLGMTEAGARKLMASVDKDGDNFVSSKELLQYLHASHGILVPSQLARMFIADSSQLRAHNLISKIKQHSGSTVPIDAGSDKATVDVSRLYNFLDTDRNGLVSARELAKGLQITSHEASRLLHRLASGKGLTLSDFQKALKANTSGLANVSTVSLVLFGSSDSAAIHATNELITEATRLSL